MLHSMSKMNISSPLTVTCSKTVGPNECLAFHEQIEEQGAFPFRGELMRVSIHLDMKVIENRCRA